MATLPKLKSPVIPPIVSTDTFFARPASEFDAGINASNAWVSSEQSDRDHNQSLSDDEEDTEVEAGRSARALYDFEGKLEFRELIVRAGEELSIIKEDLDDGWSLARADGKIGLIPKTYYTFTSEMVSASAVLSSTGRQPRSRSSSSSSLTPQNSPKTGHTVLPLEPQKTGERFRFPSFRQSLLGGKSLNRFSSFVTMGAEDWVLNGTSTDLPARGSHLSREASNDSEDGEEGEGEESKMVKTLTQPDLHFVENGPTWKPKIPSFRVMVHSPSKRSSVISGSYTVYLVTSLFAPSESRDDPDAQSSSPAKITVQRRFSHFVFLHTALTRRLPGITLPPLPEKQYAGRFSDEFVEARRGDLERYLSRVIRHPVARYAEVLTFFLGCESESEWKRLLPIHLNASPAGAAFYSQVYHPAFNLDAEDATVSVDRFQHHLQAVDKGVQGLRGIFGKVRNARLEMSTMQRLLSYGILSLITSTPIAGGPPPGLDEENEGMDTQGQSGKGEMNEEGAWCWREECEDCLRLTKALQKTAESLQAVADLHENNAQRVQLALHDMLKDVSHPSTLYAPVVETHRATLSRYIEATRSSAKDDDVAARCETVLNTTMSEFETYHRQKREDFQRFTMEYLDGEIEFYEQILSRLRNARKTFTERHYSTLSTTPRRPSIYERELPNPRLIAPPLSEPCPHVFDSAPMRPVSAAIGGMGNMLLGRGSRVSVLGKLW